MCLLEARLQAGCGSLVLPAVAALARVVLKLARIRDDEQFVIANERLTMHLLLSSGIMPMFASALYIGGGGLGIVLVIVVLVLLFR